jgi:hypothetical protein
VSPEHGARTDAGVVELLEEVINHVHAPHGSSMRTATVACRLCGVRRR